MNYSLFTKIGGGGGGLVGEGVRGLGGERIAFFGVVGGDFDLFKVQHFYYMYMYKVIF